MKEKKRTTPDMGLFEGICNGCGGTTMTCSWEMFTPQLATCSQCTCTFCGKCTKLFAQHGYIYLLLTKTYVHCPVCVAEGRLWLHTRVTKEEKDKLPALPLFSSISLLPEEKDYSVAEREREREQKEFKEKIQKRVLFWKEESVRIWREIEESYIRRCQSPQPEDYSLWNHMSLIFFSFLPGKFQICKQST